MRVRSALAAFFVVALIAAACGTDDRTTQDPGLDGAQSPAGLARDLDRADPEPDAPVASVSASINDAGFELLRTLPTDANLVFGPASIANAVLMAYAAGDEATRSQIESTYGFSNESHDGWNAIDQAIAAAQSENVTVTVADRIWPRLDIEPDPAWVELLATRHGAHVVPLDFADDGEGSRDIVNDWVADRTNDLIPDLLPPGFIRPDTVLVLTDAMYFEADWDRPFGKYPSITTDFTLLDGSTTRAELMVELELGDRRGMGDGFVGAEIPYAGNEFSMLVLVPDEGRFGEFVADLDQSLLDEIDASFTTGPFELQLPKWSTSSTIDLLDWLRTVGAAPGSYPAISPAAFIDAAVHAADIEVDEYGTVAAAATALGFAESGPPEPEMVIAADQPFVYLIRHRDSGLVLFAGLVTDPTA